MNLKGIEKFSYLYAAIKPYVALCYRFFYRMDVVRDFKEENDKAYIFAPNHQNALMDSLSIIASRWEQPIVLGRADMFKHPIAAFFLKFAKVMPVYRVRDGYENLHRNDEIFLQTIDVLRTPRGILLYPEANHSHHRSLRPLKKGLARIAMQAQEALENEREVLIVPMGMYYEHYFFMRSRMMVRYGTPFSVKPYLEKYKANKPKALLELNRELANRIKTIIPHIPYSDDRYDAIEFFATVGINESKEKRAAKQVETIQKVTAWAQDFEAKNPDGFLQWKEHVLDYQKELSLRHVDDITVNLHQSTSLFPFLVLLVLGLPIYIVGIVANYLPYKIPVYFSRRSEDKVLRATFHFAISAVLLFPLFYLLYFVLLTVLATWWIALIALPILLLSGMFAYSYFRFSKRVLRFARLMHKEEVVEYLKNKRQWLLDKFKEV